MQDARGAAGRILDYPATASDGVSSDSPFAPAGGSLRALLRTLHSRPLVPSALAVVVAASGSTYRKPGALILLPQQGPRLGWLSGGCLEAELEQAAQQVATQGAARHLRLDTRSDDDLVFGSASGCRGVVEVLLLPLTEEAPLLAALRSLVQARTLQLCLAADGSGEAWQHEQRWQWPASAEPTAVRWSLQLQAPPRLLMLGAGPETPALLQIAQLVGWTVDAVEQRGRWFGALAAADAHHAIAADAVAGLLAASSYDAVVVMSHHYSRDLDYLRGCARSAVPWIGLLGPPARRDALLAELDREARDALLPRLQAPVGLRLGGEGPEAIALAIVAALQTRAGSAA